ncbi:hypothetical protein KL928_001869 [Ogataea angusta]|uniref:TATA element modulatory factor 1 TATA binding domain-containing protein n=1 Tax=Pichia angusta TaxID=870730 RepID=A0AAN6I6D6_PICAN|nr:uncharacterized protein KL928_001869 [Ogataea angusta]KAG7820432.1 hypothetical protein KL928_001869 [Ogataea angusta]
MEDGDSVSSSEAPGAEDAVPRKKLSLQERLALAASKNSRKDDVKDGKENKEVKGPRDAKDAGLGAETAKSEFSLPADYKSLEHDALLALVERSAQVVGDLKRTNQQLARKVDDLRRERAPKRSVTPIGSDEALRRKLEEKELQIKELLEEGSKLSMKEVNLTQTIKKMKQKELDLEEDLARAEREVGSLQARVAELEAEVGGFKHNERSIKEDRLGYEGLQKKFEKVQKERDAAMDELKELKMRRLDVQVATLQKQLETELKNGARLQERLDKTAEEFSLYKEDARNQISQLTYKLERERARYNELSEENAAEIKRLENKMEAFRLLSESVDKNTDTAGVTDASSVSVDLIQAQYTQAQENWKLIESSYLKKISSLENDVEVLKQKDIASSRKIKTMQSDLKSRAAEISELLENESALRAELEATKNQLEIAENDLETAKQGQDALRKDYEVEKANLERKIQALEEEKNRLANINKLRIDTQASSQQATQPQTGFYLNEFNSSSSLNHYRTQRSVSLVSADNIALGESSTTPRPGAFAGVSSRGQSQSSFFGSSLHHSQSSSMLDTIDDPLTTEEDIFPASSPISGYRARGGPGLSHMASTEDLGTPHSSTIGGMGSSNVNGGSNIQLMGKLSSRIRRLELEILGLKDEIAELNAQKQEAANEIVQLVRENGQTKEYKEKLASLEEEHAALTSSYETTLQLLGQKSERCNELQADVDDLKDLMRSQVQELVSLQEKLAASN